MATTNDVTGLQAAVDALAAVDLTDSVATAAAEQAVTDALTAFEAAATLDPEDQAVADDKKQISVDEKKLSADEAADVASDTTPDTAPDA